MQTWPANTPFPDYSVLSGQTRHYKVRVVGLSGSTADSAVVNATVSWVGFWIHDVDDPEGTALHIPAYNSTVTDAWRAHVEYVQYEGRAGSVALESEHETDNFNAAFTLLRKDENWPLYNALIRRRGVYIVRTFEGSFYYGKIADITRDLITPVAFGYHVVLHLEGLDQSDLIA
jgi:hypothetical protein